MEVLDSIEVRWVIDDVDGQRARLVKAWFAGVPAEGVREDRYLMTGRDDLGFKARVESGKPAKVETKYLIGSLGATRLHERVVGVVERWRKLSLELDDPTLEQHGKWVRVAKSRQLRKFDWVAGAPRAVDVNTRPAAGCGLELTSLDYEVNKDRARSLTIGLEAFGPETELLRILLAVSEETFASAPELELAAEHSESYPRWLARAGLWK